MLEGKPSVKHSLPASCFHLLSAGLLVWFNKDISHDRGEDKDNECYGEIGFHFISQFPIRRVTGTHPP